MSPAELQRIATRLLETIGEAADLSVSLVGQDGEYLIEVCDLAIAPSRLVASGKAPTYWGATADVIANLLEPTIPDGVTRCPARWHSVDGLVSTCRLRSGHHGPHAHGREAWHKYAETRSVDEVRMSGRPALEAAALSPAV